MWRGIRGAIRTTLSFSAVLAAAALAHLFVMAGTATPSSGAAQVVTTLCHKPGTPAQQTVEAESSAVPGHLGHGDTIGACGGAPPTTPPPTAAPPTAAPPTAPPTAAPSPTVPTPDTTPTIGQPPTTPIPAPRTDEVAVAGASTIRTESSEIRRARIAGEGVHLAGTAPDGCRPILRVDGVLIGRVSVGPAGGFDVVVATDELAAGRHLAEVVCGGSASGVLVRKVFWIAAPLTGSDVLSVGMLSLLTLGAVGWVGIRTLRDTAIVRGGVDPSADGGRSSV